MSITPTTKRRAHWVYLEAARFYKKALPFAAFAIQGYCPICDAIGFPYNGKFFLPAENTRIFSIREQRLPLGQVLWAGAEADAGHIMAGSDPHADLEGKDWSGLHLPRI